MKIDLKKYAPPGMELKQETGFFKAGLAISALYSLFYFQSYHDAYERLWKHGEEKILIPGIKIAPFVELLDNYLIGYLIVALCMFAVAALHYAYYRQGSKSIYLMRRLPDGELLRRTCWTLPLMGMGVCAAAALISLLLFFGVYVGVTPRECLPW